MADFTLPELGEGVTTGDVLRVLVKPGETITKDQPVVELETDKATVEVPSSVPGVVKEVKVKVGDKVTVGQAILSVEDADAQPAKESVTEKSGPEPAAKVINGVTAAPVSRLYIWAVRKLPRPSEPLSNTPSRVTAMGALTSKSMPRAPLGTAFPRVPAVTA